jgi:tetratricopeptide (TPR) repeat protein
MEEGKHPFVIRPTIGERVGSERPVSHAPVAAHHEESGKARKGTWTSRLFDGVISVSLVALFFGTPIFFTGTTFQGIAFEKQIYFYFWLLLALVAWVSKGVVMGELRIRRTPLDIPIALFVAFYGIDIAFSVDQWHSFFGFFGDPSRGFLSVLALAFTYYLVLSHFTWDRFKWMFGGVVASGMVVILWSLLVLMQVPFLPASWRSYAPMSLIGTLSTLATYLSLLIPIFLTAMFAISRVEMKKKSIRSSVIGVIGFFLFLDLFLLLGLVPFISWPVLFGGMGFFLLFILAQVVRPGEQWTWVPMLVFVFVLAFYMIGPNKLLRANLPVEVAPNTSLSWSVAKEALKEKLFVGTGPASYGYAFSMYRPVEYNMNQLYTLRFYEGKGLFFEALATIGGLGTIFLLVLWLSFLSIGIYLLAFEKQRNKIYSLGLWTVAIMLVISGFFSAVNGGLLLIGSLLAILSLGVLFHESASEEKYLELTLAFIFMVVSAGVAFLFVFMGKVFVADIKMGSAVRVAVPNENTRTLIVEATRLYPNEGRYMTRLAQEQVALANQEAAKPEKDRNMQSIAFYVHEAAGAAERGWIQMSNDVLSAEAAGQVYENASLFASDALPKAFEYYEKAGKLEPNNPLLILKLGQIKKAQADQKQDGEERIALLGESKTYLEAAIEKKNNLGTAHYFLALVDTGLKDYDGALSEIAKAQVNEPSNLSYRYNEGVIHQVRGTSDDSNKAEKIFKALLDANQKLVDVRLSLGLLYEKRSDTTAAIQEYQKTLEYLTDDSTKNLRGQVEKLIANVKGGNGNVLKPNISAPETQPLAPAPALAPTEGTTIAPQQP